MKIRSQVDVLSRRYVKSATVATQKALAKSADFVAAVPERARDAVAKGRRLTKDAGKVVARAEHLVDAQLETLEVAASLGAKRLQAASEAGNLDSFVKAQLALFPQTKAAAINETRKYLELFFAAKDELDATLKTKVLGWVTPKAPKARKAAATTTVATAAA